MTIEEALAAATVDDGPVDDIIRIDARNKTIILPASEVMFGVEGDKDVERKYFKCPRIVGDNIDLYTHQIYVNYIFSDKNGTFPKDTLSTPYWCDDVALDETGNYITFSWLLSDNALTRPGYIAFAICAKYVDGESLKTRWKTTPAIGTVLMTVPDSGQAVAELYPDAIAQIFAKLDEIEQGSVSDAAIAEAVAKYMEDNPVNVEADSELSEESTNPIQNQAVAKKFSELSEEKVANSGWGTNKYLGTDSLGRVVEKGAPSSSGGDVPTFLQGYNYYAMGDSIVELQGTTANPVKFGDFGYITDLQSRDISNLTVSGYIQAIEERYGLVCTNFGASGHTLVQDYASLVAKDYSNVACATIGYGVNDARTGVPLGTVNSTDISTFAGALNMLLRKIYTDNPECRVLVLTPIQRLKVSDFGIADANANGNYLVDFVDMCKKVANKRSTKCVDMYRDCGINQTNLYFYTVEGVHPNNQGFGRMRNAVISALDDLFTIEYEPLGSMTSTGDKEADEPDTGGSGSEDNPPEEEIGATEVDISSRLTKDGYYYDGYTSVMGRGSYSGIELPLIELIEGKTYTLETYTNGNTDSRYAAVSIDENASNGTYLSYSSTDTDGNWVFTLVADGVYKASITWVAGEQKRNVSGVQTPCLYLSIGCLKGYEEQAKLSYV